MNAPSQKLVGLVNQLPEPDPNGKMTGPPPERAEGLYKEILGGGRDSIVGLIDMLTVPGEGNDWKARYMLHGIAVYVCRKENNSHQQVFADTLASQLGDGRPGPIRAFLIREIQVAGGRQAAAALGRLLVDEVLCEPAAQALVAIRQGAAEQLRRALLVARDKNRVTILQALGVLGEAKGLEAARSGLRDPDRAIRLAAAMALANSADADAADALLAASDARDVWERDQVTDACLLLAEKLLAAGRKDDARRIYQRIRVSRGKPEDRHHKAAAEKGLAAAG